MKSRAISGALAALAAVVFATESYASPALDAAVACRKKITQHGHVYAHKRRTLLLRCVDKLLKCDLLQELDGTNPGTCRSKAENSCKNTIGTAVDTPLNKAGQRFDDKAGLACAAADFTNAVLFNGAGGLWYGNDVDCGASVDLPSLLDCLRAQIELSVDTHVGELKPRAGFLLDNIGLGVN